MRTPPLWRPHISAPLPHSFKPIPSRQPAQSDRGSPCTASLLSASSQGLRASPSPCDISQPGLITGVAPGRRKEMAWLTIKKHRCQSQAPGPRHPEVMKLGFICGLLSLLAGEAPATHPYPCMAPAAPPHCPSHPQTSTPTL